MIVGIPSASFEEEMQTKITFAGSSISLGTFHHENMHQWWGDNVSEDLFSRTFFKEGYADLSQTLATANDDATAAGGAGTPAGDAAFEARLVTPSTAPTTAPARRSGPSRRRTRGQPACSTTPTPTPARAASYIALRAIMGNGNWVAANQEIQTTYGGGSITQPQQIAVYKKWMPNKSIGCLNKLDVFFKQWWDTAYTGSPAAGNKPQITGPGLAGTAASTTPAAAARTTAPTRRRRRAAPCRRR